MSEVDEKLVERVAEAIGNAYASSSWRPEAIAAISAMREAGWIAPPSSWHDIRASLDAGANESIVSAVERVLTERDREKERADFAEQTIQERNNTIACQDRRYGDLERELRELRERHAEKPECLDYHEKRINKLEVDALYTQERLAALERELRELRNLRTVDEKCEAALVERLHALEREQRAPITVPLELTGNVAAEWAKMQERLAALEQRLGSLNYEGVLSSFQQLMDRVAKLEQPEPPSAMSEEKRARLSAAGWKMGTVEEFMDDAFPREAPVARNEATAEKVTALDHAVDNARRQVRNLIERGELRLGKTFELLPGLHVWSGDVEGLRGDLLRLIKGGHFWDSEYIAVLERHGLTQATAGDAGEGE